MQFRSSVSWKLRLFHVGSYVGTSITLEYIVRFFFRVDGCELSKANQFDCRNYWRGSARAGNFVI